ncbi:MAG: anti-sigma factor antagonist [Crocosphaera sp.]|nr:anti-sigma factor antagonist [Crocosphaera sp.]
MEINLKNQQDVCIAELIGDMDGQTSSMVQEKLLPLLTPQSKIILNLTEVEYMSSAGLRVLLNLYKQAKNQAGQVILIGLSEDVKDVMEVTGFLNFFTLSNNLETALIQVNGTSN